VDAKLDQIVEDFKARLNELCPGGSREKSLAQTNIEQAQLWAEQARGVAGDDPPIFHAYGDPVAVGWKGWISRKGGVEAFVTLDGVLVAARKLTADQYAKLYANNATPESGAVPPDAFREREG
jgi:hypothetical protein